MSLTGQFQVQGKQALAGLQAWADDVNQAGGLWVGTAPSGSSVRKAVEVVFQDDAGTVERVRRVTENLITRDKVDLLFGPYSSVLTTASAAVAEEHRRVLWNQGGASDDVYQRGYRNVVGILTPAGEYLAGLLPLVRETDANARTVGIIRASRGAFPKAVTSAVERGAKTWDFKLDFSCGNTIRKSTTSDSYSLGLAAAAAGRRPDVLVAVGRIANDLALARHLADHSPAFKAVAVVAAAIDQFRQALGAKVDGFLGPSQWEQGHPPCTQYQVDYGPSTGEVLNSFCRQSSLAVDYPMVQAYAAGLVAQKCVETAWTLEDAQLREAAGRLDFSTFYGRFSDRPLVGTPGGPECGVGPMAKWTQNQPFSSTPMRISCPLCVFRRITSGNLRLVWPPGQSQEPLAYPWKAGE